MRAHIVTFSRLACHGKSQRDGEVKQRQHFCHHGDTICHPKSGYVTTKLHGTSTCRCNNNVIFFRQSYFQVLFCLVVQWDSTVVGAYLPRPVPWVNGHLLWPSTFAMYQLLCRVNVPVSDGHLPDAASGQSNVRSCPC